MSTLIRIPLVVEDMNTVAGYGTNGPSLAAMYGLVSNLAKLARIPVARFGLVVQRYDPRLEEWVKIATDGSSKARQRDGSMPLNGWRKADMVAALYLEVSDTGECDEDEVRIRFDNAINMSRVQGGNLSAAIGDEEHPIVLRTVEFETDVTAFISECEKPLSYAYLSKHLQPGVTQEALIPEYAKALQAPNVMLVCNGYVGVGEADGQLIAEPSFTLAELTRMYSLRSLDYDGHLDFVSRFFWAFDKETLTQAPNHFVVR
jgi:hypothetical protein